MAAYKFNVRRKKQPNVLARVVFTPPSLDLDPGQSGTVTVSGVDAVDRPVAVTVQSASAPAGLTVARSGNTITVTATSPGPLEDQSLDVTVEAV